MAKSSIFNELWVRLPNTQYPIIFGENLLSDGDTLKRCVKTQNVLIVSNETIAPLYLETVLQSLSHCRCATVILKDGEQYKNQESLFQIYHCLIENAYHRDSTILALGGGVVGDIAGFAASTYQRGVAFVQVPTTLLAQVDAAVGGKTAINYLQAKNCIGSFYQPSAIIMDKQVLCTLPLREFRAGIAEVIKYTILAGNPFFQMVHSALEKGLANNQLHNIAEIIYSCCQLKASVVEEDERESGVRALLNLGHTVGHALEACTHYKRWLHGEAVAIGLYVAAVLSHLHGGLEKNTVKLIDRLLQQAQLPNRIPKDIDLVSLRECMNQDKKIKNNRLGFILIKRLGECYYEKNLADVTIQRALEYAVEES